MSTLELLRKLFKYQAWANNELMAKWKALTRYCIKWSGALHYG